MSLQSNPTLTGSQQAQQARQQSSVGINVNQFSAGDVIDTIRNGAGTVGGVIVDAAQGIGGILTTILQGGAEIIRDPRTAEALAGLVVARQQADAQEDIAKEQRRAIEAQALRERQANDFALGIAREQVRQNGFAENPADIAGRLQQFETSQGSVTFDPETGIIYGGPGGGSGAGAAAPSFSQVSQGVRSAGMRSDQMLWLIAAGVGIYFLTQQN